MALIGSPLKIWRPKRLIAGLLAAGLLAAAGARAEVALPTVFSDHMILQRGKPVPVYGTAAPGEQVVVKFHGQSAATTADAKGNWRVNLATMDADTNAETMTITGSNTITLTDVLVGDVWLCSGQSNMEMRLGACNRPADVTTANFPGIRQLSVPMVSSAVPLRTVRAKWTVCAPSSAAGFSATAFYFARKIYQDQNTGIPIGLLVSSVGGTAIDPWLAPEGLIDISALQPLYRQNIFPNGPFSLFNGMIHPLAPYGLKGVIWYQGENSELTAQSPDSYFLKMKALAEGWKRLWEMDELPFYYVIFAYMGELPKDATPVLKSGGWDADTRLQQVNALALPHAGAASAIDIGDLSLGEHIWDGWHPKDKVDVGERLALWALKNDYGRSALVASGPVLKDVSVSGSNVVCSFDQIGSGLMVGSKEWYQPTKEVPDGKLNKFVIASEDGNWHPATATINGDTVILSSPSVTTPHKVAYACWQNPAGCNLYNKEGLPAAPFYVTDITKHYQVTASAGGGGVITPAGTNSLLERMTALYAITPDAGHYIQDVTVDGVSVGSVSNYTVDPVHADHVITATFATTRPRYTITASTGGGGALTPGGAVAVAQGESKSFTIKAEGDNQVAVTVDGAPLGARSSFVLSDVRANHVISATFSSLIKAEAGYGGNITPSGVVPVEHGSNRTFAITPIPGYAVFSVKLDGVRAAASNALTLANVTKAHAITATFQAEQDDGAGGVPQTNQLIFACRGASLPDKGAASTWPPYLPDGRALKAIGTPPVENIDGRKYARIRYEDGDGFSAGTYIAPVECQGASIVVVAKPVRNGAAAGWTSIVDLFYDRLVLGIRNDSGLVCVRRNGSVDFSRLAIPDGQTTILSLVVQPGGEYQVYANGAEVMSNNAPKPMIALTPRVAGPYANSITVGRNAPDGWSTFNGDIGDVFVYKTALSTAERRQLEALIAKSLVASGPK